MGYEQQNYPQQLTNSDKTIAEEGSLLVAFCNYLEKLGQTVDPPTLNEFFGESPEPLDWNSLSLYDPTISVDQFDNNDPTPPDDGPGIVKFLCTSQLTGRFTEYYACIDHVEEDRLYILDSWDGLVKSPAIYEPLYGKIVGWAIYKHITPKINHERTYVLGPKQTIWDVARKFRISAQELIDHNEIDKPHKIGEGDTLHIPKLPEVKTEPQITYQWLDEPKTYHIISDKGATKWSFGNAKVWDDITKSGPLYKRGHTVTVVGIAQVPIQGQDDPAGYYLDKISAGANFATSGRPAYTTGFSWRDLKAGAVVYPPSEVPVQDPPKPAPAPEPQINPNQYKASYKAYPDGILEFVFNRHKVVTDTVLIYDYDRLKSVAWPVERPIWIAGTFTKDGRLYGRPKEAATAGTWYGVPYHLLDEVINEVGDDEELYNTSTSLATHKLVIKNGRFSIEERVVSIPLAKIGKQRRNVLDLAYKLKQTFKEL